MNTVEIGNFSPLPYAVNEAFNTLATNLFYCGTDIRTVLITSRFQGEGKSYVAINLMRTLAGLNKRVVLVDTDLRRSGISAQHRLRYSQSEPRGLAHYLAGMCEAEDILYQTNIDNACLIPIGRAVNSSLQLLSSRRMPELLERLRREFDVVLLDTPPAGLIVDAVEIAKYCDGTLLVVAYDRGKKQEIRDVKNTIEKSGCKVLGAVLNDVDFDSYSNRKYYYKSERYSYYYGDRQYGPGSEKKRRSKE